MNLVVGANVRGVSDSVGAMFGWLKMTDDFGGMVNGNRGGSKSGN